MHANATKTRRRVLTFGFFIGFLVVLNTSTSAAYRRPRNYLDSELGEKLAAVVQGETLLRSIADDHEGVLEVGSRPDEGTAVILPLPLANGA